MQGLAFHYKRSGADMPVNQASNYSVCIWCQTVAGNQFEWIGVCIAQENNFENFSNFGFRTCNNYNEDSFEGLRSLCEKSSPKCGLQISPSKSHLELSLSESKALSCSNFTTETQDKFGNKSIEQNAPKYNLKLNCPKDFKIIGLQRYYNNFRFFFLPSMAIICKPINTQTLKQENIFFFVEAYGKVNDTELINLLKKTFLTSKLLYKGHSSIFLLKDNSSLWCGLEWLKTDQEHPEFQLISCQAPDTADTQNIFNRHENVTGKPNYSTHIFIASISFILIITIVTVICIWKFSKTNLRAKKSKAKLESNKTDIEVNPASPEDLLYEDMTNFNSMGPDSDKTGRLSQIIRETRLTLKRTGNQMTREQVLDTYQYSEVEIVNADPSQNDVYMKMYTYKRCLHV